MPIYEYECRECGHRMEAIQKFSDAPLTDCPECQKPALQKLLSAPSFRLKGGGWYETDFKTGNRRHGTQSETTGTGESAGTGSDKTSSDKNSGDKKSGNDSKSSAPESKPAA